MQTRRTGSVCKHSVAILVEPSLCALLSVVPAHGGKLGGDVIDKREVASDESYGARKAEQAQHDQQARTKPSC